ncbi:SDR family NAD(P)-dependent oxidoreductase [Alkalihalobacillus sp. BA299]|uniref:SDR family NAD(P)-dependent oxidoreductase n=1 Tax=Alkalihalobacillus sp. BA299 TaxID=2815938 RepID=UPI001ADB9E5B|nr:SDR family NAD(P)-dependent oxidoreductase [Alkalihalobacillus sp. BA299]
MSLKGKVAVITGAGGGLGQATAVRFANDGAKLVLIDLSDQAMERTVSLVKEITQEIHTVVADVTNSNDVQNYVKEAVNTFGSIDVFYNNAGIEGLIKPTTEYEEEEFDKVIAVNTKGVFLGLKYVLQQMKKQKSGSIINTASVAGISTQANLSAYTASKHSVVGLTRTAAVENARLNIRVNAICPGPIDTDMVKHAAEKNNPNNPQEFYDLVKAMVPADRLGKPEEVASLVAYLGGDESGYINGSIIAIDGGMTSTYA